INATARGHRSLRLRAPEQMNPVRFGLIGFGAWGAHHARAIASNRDAQLAAITTRSDSSRNAARQAHPSATIHGDYKEMLSRESLDVVAVVLPTHLHFDAAAAVLESGRHLLLEKPMCATIEQCDALLALAKSKQRSIAIG